MHLGDISATSRRHLGDISAISRRYLGDISQVLAYDDWRGFGLDPCPNAMRRAFFDAYKNDEDRANPRYGRDI